MKCLCQKCGDELDVSEKLAGRLVVCPTCGKETRLLKAAGPEPVVARPADSQSQLRTVAVAVTLVAVASAIVLVSVWLDRSRFDGVRAPTEPYRPPPTYRVKSEEERIRYTAGNYFERQMRGEVSDGMKNFRSLRSATILSVNYQIGPTKRTCPDGQVLDRDGEATVRFRAEYSDALGRPVITDHTMRLWLRGGWEYFVEE